MKRVQKNFSENKNSLLVILLLFSSLLFSCDEDKKQGNNGIVEVPQTQQGGWSLAWNDEFDGNRLNSDYWDFDLGTGSQFGLNGWGNNELQYYTSRNENVTLANGKLVLTAREESYEGMSYTSGRVVTRNKLSWRYGRFEIRAKLPEGQGLWPAIWMLPIDNAYGGWPQSGEIDIMELVGHEPNTVHGTVHFGDPWPDNKHIGQSFVRRDSAFSKTFNEFQIDWEPGEITWYVNDEVFFRVTPNDLSPYRYPFDQPFYLLMNVAVGGNWPGNPDGSTTFPQTMEVDYVRIYQKTE